MVTKKDPKASKDAATKKSTAAKKKDHQFTVAEYFSNQITANKKTLSGLSQDIGEVIKPNMLSMIRNSHTKLPIQHAGKVARALNIDPVYFVKMCLREYIPETWAAVEEVMQHTPILTQNEMKFIEELRAISSNDPFISTDDERREFREFVSNLQTGVALPGEDQDKTETAN